MFEFIFKIMVVIMFVFVVFYCGLSIYLAIKDLEEDYDIHLFKKHRDDDSE